MGKYRKYTNDERKQAKEANKQTKKQVDSWFKAKLQKGQEYADAKHAEAVAMIRANRMYDFCEMCGVGDPANIDYDNPHVKINWLLCDPVNLRMVTNPKHRQKFYDLLDEET